jgi:inner membrane transporter RhtA
MTTTQQRHGQVRRTGPSGAVPAPVLVLVGIVSVQFGAALAQMSFPVAGPAGVVALRLVFAALILLACWLPRRDRGAGSVVAILGFGTVLAGMNLTFYEAMSRIPIGPAVTIEFLGPLAVAIAGSRRLLDLVWALLAGTGVALLTGGGHLRLGGVLFAAAAAVCWAGYIMLAAAVGARSTGGLGLALALTWAAVLALPFGVASAGGALLRPDVLGVGLAVALLSSVVPYSLELEALRRIPPRVFGVLMSLEPAAAALAGLLVLGQRLELLGWLAVAAVVTASTGASLMAGR